MIAAAGASADARWMAYVYILRCCGGSYYVGSAVNLLLRLAQHQAGDGSAYTRRRRPIELVWEEEFDRLDDAWAREKQVKGLSRSKREALITGNHATLPGLSASEPRPPDGG